MNKVKKMKIKDLNEYKELKTGTCPHTGKRYDCARCEFPHPPTQPGIYHCCLNITGTLARNSKREWRRLASAMLINGERLKPEGARKIFLVLNSLGAECLPIEECTNFCFKHGCLGHKKEVGAEK